MAGREGGRPSPGAMSRCARMSVGSRRCSKNELACRPVCAKRQYSPWLHMNSPHPSEDPLMQKVNCHPVFRIREADRTVLVLVCLLGSLLYPEPPLAKGCTAPGFVVVPTFAVGMFPAS